MTISGRLDDVKVGEVLQFIEMGSRSGTLVLETEGAGAEIEFRQGRISSARSSTSLRLGELLTEKGLIHQDTLLAAINQQRREAHTRVLGEILLAMGAISRDDLLDAVREHVQGTILEVLGWSGGTFSFGIEKFPVKGTETLPGDLLPDVSLDTQMLLFRAAKIIDEKNNETATLEFRHTADAEERVDPEPAEVAPKPAAPASTSTSDRSSAEELPGGTLLIVSEDDVFVRRVSAVLAARFLVVAEPDTASAMVINGRPPSVALLDLRGTASVESLQALHARRPESAIVVVTNSVATANKALRAGAVASVYEEIGAVVACIENVSDLHCLELPELADDEIEGNTLERLRHLSNEIRNSLLTTSVTLTLMRILSELFERAVLFFVGSGSLVALGAFGNSTHSDRQSLAAITRGIRLPLENEVQVKEVIADRRPCTTVSADGVEEPSGLLRLLGVPASGQGVLLPVAGAERVILLVYADNGDLEKPVSDVAILELLASQVGLGIENELLRRRRSEGSGQ